MGLKSTCHLCGSVYEAVEMATPILFGEHHVMGSKLGYYLPTTGFVCQACVDANGIDIEAMVKDYNKKQLDEQRADEEHVQARYTELFDDGKFDWRDWDSSASGLGNRSRLNVGATVMVRHLSGNLKVEGIILPPVGIDGKHQMVQSWPKSGVTEMVVVMLDGKRFVRGNRVHKF